MGRIKEHYLESAEAEADRLAHECNAKHNQVIELEHENQALREQLNWCYVIVRELDHDCKASPDSGCSACQRLWEIETLIKKGE